MSEHNFANQSADQHLEAKSNVDDDYFVSNEQHSNPASSTSSVVNLIQHLRDRLQGINGFKNESGPPLVAARGDDSHDHDHEPKDFFASNDGQLLHYDTIVLMGSCVLMIVLGLVLRKVFLYLTHVRESRDQYHLGLRQMAEHMHVVTRTISNSLEEGSRRASKGEGIEDGGSQGGDEGPGTVETSFNNYPLPQIVVPPSGPSRQQSSEQFMSQLEARRLSKMHNFLVNYE